MIGVQKGTISVLASVHHTFLVTQLQNWDRDSITTNEFLKEEKQNFPPHFDHNLDLSSLLL